MKDDIHKATLFFDTCALLNLQEKAFENKFIISSTTLMEIENIKSGSKRDEETKFKARHLIYLLSDNADKYDTIVFTNEMSEIIFDMDLEENNDSKIIATALYYHHHVEPIIFVSDDIACKTIANQVCDMSVCSSNDIFKNDKDEEYKGYKEIQLNDEKMAYFYEHLGENKYDCLINEYLMIKDSDNHIVDLVKWNGELFVDVKSVNMKSEQFGNVKPIDDYQSLAIDSFHTNKITMIRGKAGSGKSYLAMGYLFSQLEKHKIDKIIVFCNTVATMDSAKLGYYPGTKDQKLLDSQIGNMLGSKLGDKIAVERLINENKLILLPMSDIRGYDTTNMNAAIYITEAQNMSVSLMKLALQRIGEDSICIIDGDSKAQLDDNHFAGRNNGMNRLSEVFRGNSIYGEVTLNTVHRSKIADIADAM